MESIVTGNSTGTPGGGANHQELYEVMAELAQLFEAQVKLPHKSQRDALAFATGSFVRAHGKRLTVLKDYLSMVLAPHPQQRQPPQPISDTELSDTVPLSSAPLGGAEQDTSTPISSPDAASGTAAVSGPSPGLSPVAAAFTPISKLSFNISSMTTPYADIASRLEHFTASEVLAEFSPQMLLQLIRCINVCVGISAGKCKWFTNRDWYTTSGFLRHYVYHPEMTFAAYMQWVVSCGPHSFAAANHDRLARELLRNRSAVRAAVSEQWSQLNDSPEWESIVTKVAKTGLYKKAGTDTNAYVPHSTDCMMAVVRTWHDAKQHQHAPSKMQEVRRSQLSFSDHTNISFLIPELYTDSKGIDLSSYSEEEVNKIGEWIREASSYISELFADDFFETVRTEGVGSEDFNELRSRLLHFILLYETSMIIYPSWNIVP